LTSPPAPLLEKGRGEIGYYLFVFVSSHNAPSPLERG